MIKSKMQLKLMFNKRRNKEITLVILLLIILLSTAITVEARGDDGNVEQEKSVNEDQNQTNIAKHKRVKRFISMRPGQRFLVWHLT